MQEVALEAAMAEVPVQEAAMVEELVVDTVEVQEATAEELVVVPVVATAEAPVEATAVVLALAAAVVMVLVAEVEVASAAVSESASHMHAWWCKLQAEASARTRSVFPSQGCVDESSYTDRYPDHTLCVANSDHSNNTIRMLQYV